MARPTKLTPAVRERIIKAVRAGNYAEAACRAAGISPSSYYRWMQRGETEESGIYHELHNAVRRAEAEAEVYAVAIIRRAMGEDWRAAMSYLERRYPSRWRRQQKTELVGEDGGPIRAQGSPPPALTRLSDDELKTLTNLLERASDPS